MSGSATCHNYHDTSMNNPEKVTPAVFVEPPNKRLFCQICQEVFETPVILSCGHTYCKKCVTNQTDGKCPVHNTKIDINVENLTENLAVAEQIGELQVYCKYRCKPVENGTEQVKNSHGCPRILRLISRIEHEEECEFQPVHCPNNPQCPILLKKDVEEHLLSCDNAKCPHHKYGCDFSGTSDEMVKHLQSTCRYEGITEYLKNTEEKIAELQAQNAQKDQDIEFLRSMLVSLQARMEQLETTCEVYESKQNEIMDNYLDVCTELQEVQNRLADDLPVSVYDPQQMYKCIGTFVGHQGPVWCLCVKGDHLFSGSSDKSIKIWDTTTNYTCVRTLEAHTGIVLALCVSGNRLYSGSQDTNIIVWAIDNDFEIVKTIPAHDNPVCTLVAARNMLFSGSLKVIKVWDTQTNELKQTISGLNHWVRALVANQDYLFSGSYQTVKIWNLENLECIKNLDISGGSVYSIAITNHYILCGTYENKIHVWESATYDSVRVLEGHNGTVYALAVMHVGGSSKVFSASYDRSLRVWSLDNMICTQTLARHAGSVACLTVSKGRVFSGAVDSTIKVWQ